MIEMSTYHSLNTSPIFYKGVEFHVWLCLFPSSVLCLHYQYLLATWVLFKVYILHLMTCIDLVLVSISIEGIFPLGKYLLPSEWIEQAFISCLIYSREIISMFVYYCISECQMYFSLFSPLITIGDLYHTHVWKMLQTLTKFISTLFDMLPCVAFQKYLQVKLTVTFEKKKRAVSSLHTWFYSHNDSAFVASTWQLPCRFGSWILW